MRRVAGLNARTLAIGLTAIVLVSVVLGVAITGALPGSGGHPAASTNHPSGAASAAPKAANQGQATTTIAISTITVPGPTLPGNITFNVNITYGVISNANTAIWVTLNTSTSGDVIYATGNGSVVAANVTTFVNNGVPTTTSNFTVFLNEATLKLGGGGAACTDVSCSSFMGQFNFVTFTITVVENGAASGGGGGWATQTDSWVSTLQSTTAIVDSSFSSPAATTFYQPFNFTAAFNVNVSYIDFGSNANTTLSVTLEVAYSGTMSFDENLSLNGTLNVSNAFGGSSTITSYGNAASGWWGAVSFTVVLNNVNLGIPDWATFVTDLGTGGTLTLTAWATPLGATAGGLDPGISAAAESVTNSGTVTIFGGGTNAPVSFQGAPYTQTGWVNFTWVPADFATNGNSSVGGYFLFEDVTSGSILASYSVNESVNTTNADGVSLTPVTNGTVFGQTWVNYSWSVTIGPSVLSGTTYGDDFALFVSLYANGGVYLPVTINVTAGGVIFGPTPFAQHPTVATAAYTTPVTGFIDISSAPYDLNFTISVTNGTITAATTSVVVSVVDATIPAPIYNYSLAVNPGQTAYTFPITESELTLCNASFWIPGTGPNTQYGAYLPVCPSTAPTDDFYFTVNVTENGIGGATNGSLSTFFASEGPAFFIGTPATITLLSPSGTTLPTGNVTFVTFYAGDFVSGANLTVFSGTVTVFHALMTQLSAGVPAVATWTATAAGTYSVVVSMTRTSGPPVYANSTLTILSSAGTLVYQNSSTYHNVTLLGSLSPAVAGTILLLVGLIVGMIVALLVGRMMWGGSKPQEPPQQWEQGQTAGGTSTEAGTGTMESGGTDSGTPPSGSS
jgi:hypothetical protein